MITETTCIKELKTYPVIKEIWPYLIYNNAGDGAGNLKDENWTLSDINQKNPTWSAKDMAYGLNTILDIANEQKPFLYSVYDEKEVAEDPKKACVKLMFFPTKERKEEAKTAILAAGGGYGAVCSMCESFPVAAKMREMGINVFCLNYRVAGKGALLPKPMEDLAAAYAFLKKNEKELGICMKDYAVGGFSAGGHLTASWGTIELGYRKYGYEKPKALLLDYPLINIWRTMKDLSGPLKTMMLVGLFGVRFSEKKCKPYDVDLAVDKEYPATYMIQAEDDTTVPIWNCREFAEKLESLGVPCEYELVAGGGHGYGLGTDTPAEGWVERAVDFWERS